MAARGGFQTAPTGGGGGAMGPGPPVPGAGPGMGPGTPSGRMVPSPAAQNHMYRSPMPGPGYPVRYRSVFATVALASPLEQSLLRLLCHQWLIVTVVTDAAYSFMTPVTSLKMAGWCKSFKMRLCVAVGVCSLNLLTLPPATREVSHGGLLA